MTQPTTQPTQSQRPEEDQDIQHSRSVPLSEISTELNTPLPAAREQRVYNAEEGDQVDYDATEPNTPRLSPVPSESIIPAEPNAGEQRVYNAGEGDQADDDATELNTPPPAAGEQRVHAAEEDDQVDDDDATELNTPLPPPSQRSLSPVAGWDLLPPTAHAGYIAPPCTSDTTKKGNQAAATNPNTLSPGKQRDDQLQSRASPPPSPFPTVDPAFIAKVLASRARGSARLVLQTRRYIDFPQAWPDETDVWEQNLDTCFFSLGGDRHIACHIYFDTTKEEVIVQNRGSGPIVLTQDGLATVCGCNRQNVISAKSFLLHINGPKGVTVAIAFAVLPRPFRETIVKLPIRVVKENPAGIRSAASASRPLKRQLVDAYEHPAKRGRQTDGAPLTIQPPQSSSSPATDAATPQAMHTVVNPDHSHAPLETCCYTLSRVKSLRRDGSVFVGRHSGLAPGLVVVKNCRKSSLGALGSTELWLAEYRAYRALGYPLISQPFLTKLFGIDARILNLYIEHLDVPDLTAMCDRKSSMFLPKSVSPHRIISDVVGALAYAHGHGVTHNDIKPGNILFDHHRGAVVCDWGLATIGPSFAGPPVPPGEQPDKAMSHLAGTSWYLCPEARVGQVPEPPRDIFALGVLALWILRHMALPESFKEYYFTIACTSNPNHEASHIRRKWLYILDDTAGKLDDHDLYEKLTRQMLSESPKFRLTASQMNYQLCSAIADTPKTSIV